MPRRFLQRYMPKPETLSRQRSLRFMSHLIADPGLWILSRRSVANAFSVGLFSAMLPIPFQMVVAAFGAWVLRCNLPLSVGLVWITNPLTMPLIFYGNYRLGAWLMQAPAERRQSVSPRAGSPSRWPTSCRHWPSARWPRRLSRACSATWSFA